MEAELNADLVWSLRALAQDANTQRGLYPHFAVGADHLANDFSFAYEFYKEATHTRHADLDKLLSHMESKSGIWEFWSDKALEQSAFWNTLRELATHALNARGLPTSPPNPSPDAFVSADEVWVAGHTRAIPKDEIPTSVLSRFLSRFR